MSSNDGHELDVGCRIRLSGLVKADHLNGKLGIIDGKAEDDDNRWIVILEEGDQNNDESKPASTTSKTKTQSRRRVKVRPANCILVSNEESRLKEAMESKDRDTIRSIMLSRQSRKKDMPTSDNKDDKKPNAFDRESFCCPICHNLLYKPCVNSCGHAFCFWCLHHAMNGVGTSKCPLCRAPYTRFSAPLQLLHRFLTRAFAEETQRRSLEIQQQENSDNAQSPTIDLNGSQQPHLIGPVDASELICVSCKDIVKDPVVPACGHLICLECVIDSVSDSTSVPQCMECSTPILDGKCGSGGGDATKELKVCAVLQPLLNSVNGAVDSETIKTLCREGGSKKRDLSSNDADHPPSVKVEFPEINKESKQDFIHFYVGCDGCGQYPMIGHAFRCLDCPEQIGFDLCRSCFSRGVHLRPDVFKGRFNQSHKSTHKFEERKQTRTGLHTFMDLHPTLTPAQIMHLVQLQNGSDDDDEEESNNQRST